MRFFFRWLQRGKQMTFFNIKLLYTEEAFIERGAISLSIKHKQRTSALSKKSVLVFELKEFDVRHFRTSSIFINIFSAILPEISRQRKSYWNLWTIFLPTIFSLWDGRQCDKLNHQRSFFRFRRKWPFQKNRIQIWV